MNVYFRRVDGSLGKYIVSGTADPKQAIKLVRDELTQAGQLVNTPILAVIPHYPAKPEQEAA